MPEEKKDYGIPHGAKEDKNLGGIRYSGEKAPLSKKKTQEVSEGQETLDSLLKPQEQAPRRKLQKETWYTVSPGIEFRTAPEGSEPGSPFAGVIKEPTRIRVVGTKAVRSGIASVYGVFEQDGEQRSGWFNLKEIRRKKKA